MIRYFIYAMICLISFCTATNAAALSDLLRDMRFMTAEQTESTSFFSDTLGQRWLNLAQSRITKLGGYIPKQIDIVYSEDSTTYVLPSDFRKVDQDRNLMITETEIKHLFLNPGFITDTNVAQYFISWKNEDTALLYLEATSSFDGDTARIFYLGTAAEMLYDTSTCEVPTILHDYIIQEAVSYYIFSQKRYQEAFLIQQNLRRDMGIPVKE